MYFFHCGDKQGFSHHLSRLVSALTELGDMEGYGHVYIGPFNPALCNAATLFIEHWEVGLAAPGCLAPDWPSLPPITPPTKVLFTVLRFFRWAHVAVISGAVYGGEDGWGWWAFLSGVQQCVASKITHSKVTRT